jgi:hypothetical protein
LYTATLKELQGDALNITNKLSAVESLVKNFITDMMGLSTRQISDMEEQAQLEKCCEQAGDKCKRLYGLFNKMFNVVHGSHRYRAARIKSTKRLQTNDLEKSMKAVMEKQAELKMKLEEVENEFCARSAEEETRMSPTKKLKQEMQDKRQN